jgi:hypothetical protein
VLSCGVSSPPPGCVGTCLSSGAGLSTGCAACYDAGVQCLLQNCFGLCSGNPSDPTCVACRQQYCDGPFATCSGWPQP